ncbi:FAD:protein FMN transferase [Pseudogemmobacter humi]|uniref:FAD:protein FMN transferase n=1 Tax=Pseudogemmobacter humi TaxID=2483812 RepID=A0A3P5WE09_9RHOB|nr:FAD:protein FMN transferase [Pseudogemmobacter humi]VDC19908.1 Thiamine biosynthesis lipoprotein ApbE precursor [Pseudogemmobacter humi]
MHLTRRRFLTISAVAATLPGTLSARPVPQHWTGQALGARASIRLEHPEAEAITARCLSEIDRLENILSLYREDSALSRLNREGGLEAPPFELLDCLTLAGLVHRETGGLFDVTLQPLWALWAESAAAGRRPGPTERSEALARTGWEKVRLSAGRITLAPGMALTLNGIGQGYVADRVAALLDSEGLTNILIDTGELRALGPQPDGAAWPVRIAGSGTEVPLAARALATSAPRGTCFDAAGRDGHILDARTGAPADSPWSAVSVSAPQAALADALSTAICLTRDQEEIGRLMAGFPAARIEDLRPA